MNCPCNKQSKEECQLCRDEASKHDLYSIEQIEAALHCVGTAVRKRVLRELKK